MINNDILSQQAWFTDKWWDFLDKSIRFGLITIELGGKSASKYRLKFYLGIWGVSKGTNGERKKIIKFTLASQTQNLVLKSCFNEVTLHCVYHRETQHKTVITLIWSGMAEALAPSVAVIVHQRVILPPIHTGCLKPHHEFPAQCFVLGGNCITLCPSCCFRGERASSMGFLLAPHPLFPR